MEKPFSQACENNKQPIGDVLAKEFGAPGLVLEIGSGTGQHSHYFHQRFDHLAWQCSDVAENLSGIFLWHNELDPSPAKPFEFDINMPTPDILADYIYSANTVHIMSWEEVIKFFSHVGKLLKQGGKFALYGPFNYSGKFTSESNSRFNDWLKEQAPHRAIRDFEEINKLAVAQGLELTQDYEMPANNRTLVWKKN